MCMHRYLAPKARYVRSNRFLVEILRRDWRKPFRSNLKIIFDWTFLRLWRHHETTAFPGLIRNPGMCATIVETVWSRYKRQSYVMVFYIYVRCRRCDTIAISLQQRFTIRQVYISNDEMDTRVLYRYWKYITIESCNVTSGKLQRCIGSFVFTRSQSLQL